MATKMTLILLALLVAKISSSKDGNRTAAYEKESSESLLDILTEMEKQDPTVDNFEKAIDVMEVLREKHVSVLESDIANLRDLLQKLQKVSELLSAEITEKRQKIEEQSLKYEQCRSELLSRSWNFLILKLKFSWTDEIFESKS